MLASPSFFGRLPERAKLRAFRGPRDTLATMATIAHGPRGEKSYVVRQFLESVIGELQPKDYLGEILAVRNVFLQPSPKTGGAMFRYANDPRHVEWIKDPQRMVEEILDRGYTVSDCDEAATMKAALALQLGREVEFVALGFAPKSLTHVGVRVREPKSREWIWLDSVAGPREREAANRAVEVLTWSLD